MKTKIAILAYILGVLALSGMVKASAVESGDVAQVQSAEISPTGILDLAVILKDTCHTRPRVTVNIDQDNKKVALAVRTQVSKSMCLDVIKTKEVIFDLKSLPLRVGTTYDMAFENVAGSRADLNYMAVSGISDEDYTSEKQDFKGVLIPTLGTEQNPAGLALRNDKNEVVPVKSPDMLPLLSSLVNGEVYLTGYAVSIAALNNGLESQAQSSQSENFAQVIVPVSVSQ